MGIYKDRHANLRLIKYFIKHTDEKKLQKILNLVSEELARRSK